MITLEFSKLKVGDHIKIHYHKEWEQNGKVGAADHILIGIVDEVSYLPLMGDKWYLKMSCRISERTYSSVWIYEYESILLEKIYYDPNFKSPVKKVVA